jgi:hypothetical protein
LTDLPSHLGPGWQNVDVGIRALRLALRSTDFQQLPKVVAVLQSEVSTLTKLVATYTEATAGGTSTPSVEPAQREPGSLGETSADADSQPAPTGGDDET